MLFQEGPAKKQPSLFLKSITNFKGIFSAIACSAGFMHGFNQLKHVYSEYNNSEVSEITYSRLGSGIISLYIGWLAFGKFRKSWRETLKKYYSLN